MKHPSSFISKYNLWDVTGYRGGKCASPLIPHAYSSWWVSALPQFIYFIIA